MANTQTRIMVTLVAILLAVVVVSALVLWVLPRRGSEAVLPDEELTAPTTSTRASGTGGFNVNVLQTAAYTTLNKQLIIEGALPVQPPPTTGKANPFL